MDQHVMAEGNQNSPPPGRRGRGGGPILLRQFDRKLRQHPSLPNLFVTIIQEEASSSNATGPRYIIEEGCVTTIFGICSLVLYLLHPYFCYNVHR